ncbi:MAG: PAS domain S-box protein [Caldilineaceae bacterium]
MALKESEAIYRLTLSNISDAVFVTDDAGQFTFICPNVDIIFGYAVAQVEALGNIRALLGDNLFDPHILQELGEIANIECDIQRPSGEIRHLLVTVKAIQIEDGTHLYTCRDVTERMLANAAKHASEEKYRLLAENATEVITVTDVNTGRYSYVSPSVEQMFGFTAEEALQQASTEVVQSGVLSSFFQELPARIQAFLAGDPDAVTRRHEAQLYHRDGSAFWAEVITKLLQDDAGNLQILSVSRDITERRQAEEALRVGEEKYRSLIESSDAVIVQTDQTGRMLFVNEVGARMQGQSPDALIGKLVTDIFPPDTAQQQIELHHSVFETGRGQVAVCPVRLPHETRWYRTSVQPVRDAVGDITSVMVNASDITSVKQSEAALQSLNEQLEQRVTERTAELERAKDRIEAIFNHSGDGILLLDVHQRIEQANHAFETMCCGAVDCYRETPFSSFFHVDNAHDISTAIGEAAASHELRRVEARAKHHNGDYLDVELSIAPVNRTSKAVTNLVCIVRDITARKQAEKALRESEARYQSVVQTQSELICRYLPDLTLIFVNNAYCRYFDKQPGDLIGRSFLDLVPAADQQAVKTFYENLVRTRGTATYEHQAVRADGVLRWQLWTDNVVLDDDGNVVAIQAVGVDITERKQAEATLEMALAQEKELGELKSRFVSMASHEFRTPLAAILATTETLTHYRQRMDSAQIDTRLDRIRQQVNHMQDIMEDVLMLARIQAGRLDFAPTTSDVDALFREIVEEFRSRPEYRERIVYVCEDAPIVTSFDLRLMRQIVSNLVSNALKYSAADTSIRIEVTCADGTLRYQVTDEGIGIPPEDMKRLFQPFHRAGNVGAISGTGLGLSITKEAVEAHQGSITVASEVDNGTTFTVVLPLAREDGASAS